ncbi:MAG TPA: hypothetical protein VGR72_02590, partial [Candidatus Acidoferrales bacterium]|nr:hypothetical protein [Candidatus Acidoferrales bacterium]
SSQLREPPVTPNTATVRMLADLTQLFWFCRSLSGKLLPTGMNIALFAFRGSQGTFCAGTVNTERVAQVYALRIT